MEFSNLETHEIVEELQKVLDERVKKVQLVSEKEYKLRLEKNNIVIAPPEALYLTKRPYPAKRPDNFSMYARKRLSGKRVKKITQNNFDRVITIHFEDGYKLIAELFGEGNLILLDKANLTRKALEYQEWRDRKIKKKEEYRYPQPRGKDPFKMNEEGFVEQTKNERALKALKKLLNMGEKYLKEICQATEIQEQEKLNEEKSKKLFKELKELLKKQRKPGIQTEPVIFPLKSVEEEFEEKESFNAAVDDYRAKEKKSRKKQTKEKKLSKLQHRLKQQKNARKKFKEQIKQYKEKGNWIYNHLNELKQVFMQEDFNKKIDGLKIKRKGKKLVLEE